MIIGYLVYFTVNLEVDYPENLVEILISSSYYFAMFVVDLFTIFYFINMAQKYLKILQQHYDLKIKVFSFYVCFLTICIILTLFKFDVYYNLP